MSKAFQQKNNLFVSNKQAKQQQTIKNQKSNDFIFKRYRYEQNTILQNGKVKGTITHNLDYNQYENKENQLEKYKLQLQKQNNHFDIVEFGQDDESTQHQNKFQKSSLNHQNPFHFDQDRITWKDQSQKISQKSQQLQSKLSNNHKNFDLKPMELVDFDQQDQNQIVDKNSINSTFIPNTLTQKQNKSHLNQSNSFAYPEKNSQNGHSRVTSFAKSNASDSFMISPNQTLDHGLGLEQSAYNFIKKDKSNNNNPKTFSPQNIGLQKYQIQKLSQKDNPFENAVDYSNDQQLRGIKIYQSPYEDIRVEIFDKNLFVSSKIPPGIILKCKLKRSTGFFSLMNPQFDLYLQNGLKHLVSARKNLFRNRQLFHLSTQTSNFQKPIRTLMANVLHNTYWLVDSPKVIDRKKISYLDLLIEYQSLNEQKRKQRQMIVLCPPTLKTYHIGLEYDIPYVDFQWFKKSISLKLYFKGLKGERVKNSEKNFELIDSEEEELQQNHVKQSNESAMIRRQKQNTGKMLINNASHQVLRDKQRYLYLKMQKQSQNIFDVEIQHPLTPLQAMAIILTRFDAQLK